MAIFNKRSVSPVIAIVLLLMMTVAAAGAAYFWITSMQSSVQQSAGSQIEAITKSVSTRILAQATICKGINEVNLKAYWKMDEGSGIYANDSGSYGADGTLRNGSEVCSGGYCPDWVNGKFGKAIYFDAKGDWARIDEDPFDFDTSDYTGVTISAWVRAKDVQEGNIIFLWHTVGFKGMDSSNLRAYTHIYPDDSDYRPLIGGFSLNEWHYVVWTFDYSSGRFKGYMDGEVKVNEVPYGKNKYFSDAWGVSGLSTYGADHMGKWNGTIDEVRIYNRALSQAQVEYLNDTNKAMGRYVDITVYNAGTEEVPKGAWVANLKKDGTTVDSGSYNASKLPPEERITLNFYFDKMKPNKEYTIELEGTATSTTVSC